MVTPFAERSFSLFEPCADVRQANGATDLGPQQAVQDEIRKTERLKDFKEASSVHDNMRALGTQCSKAAPGASCRQIEPRLCVGKQISDYSLTPPLVHKRQSHYSALN